MKLITLLIITLFTLVFSQTDSMILVKKSDIPASVVQKYETAEQIKNVGQWIGLGKEVGGAIREGLGALTDETDKFSKTQVGKFTMFIIGFKVLGDKIIQIIIGIPLLITITGLFIYYVFTQCRQLITLTTVTKTEGKVEIKKHIEEALDYEDANNRIMLACIFYVIMLIIITVIIFAG